MRQVKNMGMLISYIDLGLLFAELSIMTIGLSEFLGKYHGDVGIIVDRYRLERVSFVLILIFILLFLYQFYLSLITF